METGDSFWVRELETVSLCIVVQNFDIAKLQIDESLFSASEDLGAILGLFGNDGLAASHVSVHACTDTNRTNDEGNVHQIVATLCRSLRGIFAKALEQISQLSVLSIYECEKDRNPRICQLFSPVWQAARA